ncbi:putative UviB [[Clostridium] sordellii]|uniref:BhlA/UviB family holin-like peptide n=1 Tax=Paraclostridium sordellii TaxID=1505 RepID=UPI0005E6D96A|nr:BhlA/UviB family holin-like peptide [Paeniclostridium sordellii]CEP46369.1 putative UviB [[Clostridium] sordellii] [Paeniclostridium sordellii]
MENEILKIISSQGIGAVLSLILILYILKSQEKRDLRQQNRELAYQKIISNLSDKLSILDELNENIKNLNYLNVKEK